MTTRLPAQQLGEAVAFLLEQAGAETAIAAEVAESLVGADLCGRPSHGARLTGPYVRRLLSGEIPGTARPTLEPGDGPVRRVQGNGAFGQIVGAFAVREGVRAARRHGIAAVAVAGASHFGRNGLWAEMAADEGVASLHFMNVPSVEAAIVPHGGRDARLTSNPVAFGAPHPDGDHVIADFSIGTTSVNAIQQAAEDGLPLQSACVIGPDGALTADPAVFLAEGGRRMLGFGEHKGFAIGLISEIFAGILSGGGCHTGAPGGGTVNNMFSIYLDVAALVPPERYGAQIRDFTAWIASSAPAEGFDAVTLPGQRSRAARARNAGEGIAINPSLAAILTGAATAIGVKDAFTRRWPMLGA